MIRLNFRLFWIAVGILFSFCLETKASVTSLTAKECTLLQQKGVITPSNPVSCVRLRRVNFQYVNFDNAIKTGGIVVLDVVAGQTDKIFSELFTLQFPIHKAVGMEHYEGNDEAAMLDNNTSAFNGRPISGGSSWSKHAYGVAIDLNPVQNPYICLSQKGVAKILPPTSAQTFVNRNDIRPNKKTRSGKAEEIVEIFTKHGFLIWGGEWDFPIDYQHFEIGSQTFIDQLLKEPPHIAQQIFNKYAESYRSCVSRSKENNSIKRRVVCIEQVRK